MTLQQAQPYFFAFRDIHTAHHANTWKDIRKRDKHDIGVLKIYMAYKGCYLRQGKFEQVWEYNKETDTVQPATLSPEGFIGWDSIQRQPNCSYFLAYSEAEVLRKVKV